MATITSLTSGNAGTHVSRGAGRLPYVVEAEIDIAAALAAKGSALAANDIIEAISVPAGSVVLTAGLQVKTAPTAGFDAGTLDVGVTGVDVDVWVDGFDLQAAAAGAWSQNPAAYQPVVVGSADTIDVLIATLTQTSGSLEDGVIRVFAVLVDVSDRVGPVDVDRDQLA